MKYCVDADSLNSNKEFIEKFKKIYDAGFPDVNEREDFEVILNRVGNNSENDPHSILLIHTNTDESEVTGGLIVDWYKNSKSIHLIYLIISVKYREKGIAKELINNGVPWIKNWIRSEKGIEISNVFFESNIPWKTNKGNDNFDAEQRLRIFSKMGAKLIDIPYVQPALDKKKKVVENLFLLSFTQFNKAKDHIPGGEILAFLGDLYQSLLVNDFQKNASFRKMEKALNESKNNIGLLELKSVPTELEETTFEFKSVSVTCHFIEEALSQKSVKDEKFTENVYCPYFSSFERDLLNFQNQKNQPFSSVLVKSNQQAVLTFPKIYSYSSEGIKHTFLSERTELEVIVSISYSIIHLSNKRLWHLTISPAHGKVFTEYDVIKLSSLFGSSQEESTVKENIQLQINGKHSQKMNPSDFVKFLAEIQDDKSLKSSGTGIVEIDSTEFRLNLESFFKIFTLQERTFFSDDDIKKVAKAVCGILLGIFDFNRMDEEEIFDTIQPIMPNELSLMVMCRGALFKISDNDEIMDTVRSSILISPYLLIPSTVLAYNEYLLTEAKQILTHSLAKKSKINLSGLDKNQAEINRLINYIYLEGLFQYPTENLIVERGNIQRGLTFLKSNIETRLMELKAKIESKRSNFTLFTDSVIALVLFLIALWEFYKNFSQNLVPIFMISVIVVVVYIFVMIKKRT